MIVLKDDNIEYIKYGILDQANTDFITAKRQLYKLDNGYYDNVKKPPCRDTVQRQLDEVIDFFYSDWFTYLYPKVDPQFVIDKLDARVDEWIVKCEKESNARYAYGVMKRKLYKI